MSPTPHQPVLKKINLPSPRNNWGEGDSCWPLNRILRWGGVWKRACWLEEGYKFAGPLGASGLSDPLVARALTKRKTVSAWGGGWPGKDDASALPQAAASRRPAVLCFSPPSDPPMQRLVSCLMMGRRDPFITGTPPGWVGFGSLSFKCLFGNELFCPWDGCCSTTPPKTHANPVAKGGQRTSLERSLV